jgi:hypothetical protein
LQEIITDLIAQPTRARVDQYRDLIGGKSECTGHAGIIDLVHVTDLDEVIARADRTQLLLTTAAGGRAVPKPEVEYIMPEFAPVLTDLIANARLVLVQRSTQAHKATRWDVLSYEGRLLGTLQLPANFRPQALSGDRIYGVEKDDLDVESVAVYRIVAPR